MSGSWPAVNASLNAVCAVLLLAGWGGIRLRRIHWHVACMASALAVSAAFLVSYLLYHAHAGSVQFVGTGWMRPVYFTILLTHTVLAVAVVPLALRSAWLGRTRRFDAHVRLARWTLPIWLYVSVTGVVVYAMLYHLQ
jgi:uncharacterized membrane protein YozB (DUF420 family)